MAGKQTFLQKIESYVVATALGLLAGTTLVTVSLIPFRVTKGPPAQMGPYREVLQPIAYDSPSAIYDMRSRCVYEWRNQDLDAEITACRATGQGSPRFKAWVDLLGQLQKIDDPLLKVQLVNGWFNSLLRYDDNLSQSEDIKLKGTDGSLYQRYETVKETLDSGTGICTDYAIAKYETLKRAGIDPAQMRLITGCVTEDKVATGHMILMVDVCGQNWVLTDWTLDKPDYNNPHLHKYLFSIFAELVGDSDYLTQDNFTPSIAENNCVFLTYMAGTKDNGLPLVTAPPVDPTTASVEARLAAASPATQALIAQLMDQAYKLSGSYQAPAPPPAPKPPVPPPAPKANTSLPWPKPTQYERYEGL